VGTLINGEDCVFQLSHQGWERRHEFPRQSPRFSASAIAVSSTPAVSRIANHVPTARRTVSSWLIPAASAYS
jgi:hypothetical protein